MSQTATTEPAPPSAKAPQVALDPRVLLLREFFFNRQDKVAVRSQKGKKRTPFPVRPEKGDPTPLLTAHVLGKTAPEAMVRTVAKDGCFSVFSGHFRVGSYAPALNGTTRWLCLDFDGAGHSNPLRDARGAALATVQNFYTKKIPCYLERSGGGHGYHVWVFFSSPVPASDARALGFQMACQKAPLQKGGFADPERGQGIEVFPKQEKVSPKGVGNMVYLPWWSGAPGGANQFYPVSPEGLMGANPFVPETFDTLKPEDLDWQLAEIQPDFGLAQQNGKSPRLSPPTKEEWKQWRIQALEKLDLEDVYGRWLSEPVGKQEWISCTSPLVAKDENPSARVATGHGAAEKGTFHTFHTGKSYSVFSFLEEMGLVDDFREAKEHIARLTGVPTPVSTRCAAATGTKHRQNLTDQAAYANATGEMPPLTAIKVDQQYKTLMEETWTTVHARNRTPTLFSRSGGLAIIKRRKGKPPQIAQMSDVDVFGYLFRLCAWERNGEDGPTESKPPMDLARDLLAYPHENLPELDALIQAPIFGKDGTLLNRSGYHALDQVWYEPDPELAGLEPVPAKPTARQMEAAKALLLNDMLFDFPFVSEADKANYLATLLLPFMRRMITSCTPLHLVEAPSIGSGKSLLCSLIALILTGKGGVASTFPVDETEQLKRITSELILGRSLVLLDNASENRKLASPHLAAVLTGQEWSDRILGKSEMVTQPNQSVWLMTGNNPQLSLEIARRCVRIRIASKTVEPWRRSQFKHPDLLEWVRANRPKLLHAVLTLIQYWVCQGRPMGNIVLGSYENWASTMGGLLESIGVTGFLGNLDNLYADSDSDGAAWAEFTQAWWEAFGAAPKKVTDLNDLCEEKNLLDAVRRDGSARSQEIRLGLALSRKRDCVCGEFTIVRIHTGSKGKRGQEYALLRHNEGNTTETGGLKVNSILGDGVQREFGLFTQGLQEGDEKSKLGCQQTPVTDTERTPKNADVADVDADVAAPSSALKTPCKNGFCDASADVADVFPPLRVRAREKITTPGAREDDPQNIRNIRKEGEICEKTPVNTGVFTGDMLGQKHPHQHPQHPQPAMDESSAFPDPAPIDLADPALLEFDEEAL